MTKLCDTRSGALGRRAALLLLGAALAGCQSTARRAETVAATPAAVQVEEEPANSWRRLARETDIARLGELEAAWTTGLEAARRGGFARRVAAEGALLNPAGALPHGMLPPGSYRCRVIRLGAIRPRGSAFSVSAPFFCFVGADEDLLAFTKQTGPERPGGYLYPDGERRAVFLGASASGRETAPPPYGARADRDVIGAVERVGPFRYRLVMPRPRSGAAIEVMELIPSLPNEALPRVARR